MKQTVNEQNGEVVSDEKVFVMKTNADDQQATQQQAPQQQCLVDDRRNGVID